MPPPVARILAASVCLPAVLVAQVGIRSPASSVSLVATKPEMSSTIPGILHGRLPLGIASRAEVAVDADGAGLFVRADDGRFRPTGPGERILVCRGVLSCARGAEFRATGSTPSRRIPVSVYTTGAVRVVTLQLTDGIIRGTGDSAAEHAEARSRRP